MIKITPFPEKFEIQCIWINLLNKSERAVYNKIIEKTSGIK